MGLTLLLLLLLLLLFSKLALQAESESESCARSKSAHPRRSANPEILDPAPSFAAQSSFWLGSAWSLPAINQRSHERVKCLVSGVSSVTPVEAQVARSAAARSCVAARVELELQGRASEPNHFERF